MQPQREAMTSSLADIIHIVRLGGKSGTLSVERGEGRTLEEGFITFIDGRVVEARVSQQSGQAAFTYLNTWRSCRFSFVSSAVNSTPSLLQPAPFPSPKHGSLPASTSTASALYFDTMTPISQNHDAHEHLNRSVFIRPLRLQPGEEMVQHPENNVRLPRIHQRLLILVNGQRNVSELARLMARRPDEIQELLNDLERSGFIRQ